MKQMTEQEAKGKKCPFDPSVSSKCMVEYCMAWEWDATWNEVQKKGFCKLLK